MVMALDKRLSAASLAALGKGNKIEAIKITREEHRLGLKEARDMIERYLNDNPSLKTTIEPPRSSNNFALFLVVLIGAAAIFYVSRT